MTTHGDNQQNPAILWFANIFQKKEKPNVEEEANPFRDVKAESSTFGNENNKRFGRVWKYP